MITYVPAATCLELKSLKLYLFGYRDRGIFYEHAVNTILDDLVASCRPVRMKVVGQFNPRGGITLADHGDLRGGTGLTSHRRSAPRPGTVTESERGARDEAVP